MKPWLGIVVMGSIVGSLVASGCGGSTKAKATPKCVLNSDCHGPNDAGATLVCALGFCVSPCNDSSDCPLGELCIKSDNGNACRAPEIAKGCVMNSDCTKLCTDVADDGGTADSGSSDGGAAAVCPIICGRDDSCRTECKTNVDCPGGNLPDGTVGMQKCTTSGACIDPIVDMSIYDPATNDFKSSVTGGAGATGAAGKGGGGSGGSGSAGSGGAGPAGADGGVDVATGMGGATGAAGTAGAAGAPCTGTQLQFSNPIKGDVNASFTSGVAVANADTVFVFSGYHGPLPADGGASADADAGASMGSAVYVQSFDLKTQASLGPAVPFLFPEDGPGFYVQDVAIAPTGEIVLLYEHTSASDSRAVALFASFLTTTAGADGGAPTLHVQRTVQLESVPLARAHVIWAASSQTFICSWKYLGAVWFPRIKTFKVDGTPGTGSVGTVPTRTQINDNNEDDVSVGTVGPLVGMAVRDTATGEASLTILGSDGLQVGDFVTMEAPAISFVGVAGTTSGFVTFANTGTPVLESYAPTTGAGSVLADGGADGSVPMPVQLGTFSSTIHSGRLISDDTSAGGGVGAGLWQDDGAAFLYVTADGSKTYQLGTVISASNGGGIAVTNYHGSFAVSLYLATGATAVVTSSCGL
jgi:hypothetical protein